MSYAYEDKIKTGLSFISYVVLRLGRIYPLHLFVLLTWIPYLLIKQYLYNYGLGGIEQFEKNNIFTFFSNLLLIHSMGLYNSLTWNFPSWSISTEFFTYLAFYVFTVSIDKGKSLVVPLIIIIGCYSFLFQLGRENLDITYDYGAIRCLGAFYLGVLTLRIKRAYGDIKLTSIAINILELIIVISIILNVTFSNEHYLYIVFCLLTFAFAILVFSNKESGLVGRLLTLKISRKIGMWSYSIYLLHAIVLGGVSNVLEYILKISPNVPQGFLSIVINTMVLLITIVLSKYSYEYIETRYRDKIKLKLKTFNQPREA